MGCDIHIWIEVKQQDDWYDCIAELHPGRNYTVFGYLAGVRVPNLNPYKPKGVPEHCSFIYKYAVNEMGLDAHSHSWLNLKELKEIKKEMKKNKEQGAGGMIEYWIDIMEAFEKNYKEETRIVFFFDN